MFKVPNLAAALTNAKGVIQTPWNSFFQQFTQNPPSVQRIIVGASPFSLTQNDMGNFVVSGGTVSDISLIRGNDTIHIASNTAQPVTVPVSLGDTIQVTWTVKPNIQFLPTWGNSK